MQDGTEMVQVGAFPFPTGTGPLTAFNARVVDEGTSSLPLVGDPIIEAMPLEESEQRETQVLQAVLKSRKCRIRILAMTVILIVGLIVAVVLVTQNSSKALPSSASPQAPNTAPPGFETSTPAPSPSSPSSPSTGLTTEGPFDTTPSNPFPTPAPSPSPSFSGMGAPIILLDNETQAPTKGDTNSASNTFLAKLKPLLSSKSLTALNDPDSPQSQSLQWLLEKSNFQAWSFPRQVQRYAMATFYYATGAVLSWSNDQTWLTNETECLWFQGSRGGGICGTNGTSLQSLERNNNGLNGTIPDEIGLLTSLTLLDLHGNQFSGTVPLELGSLTALTSLYLSLNAFTGTLPSELGSLSDLTSLSLNENAFRGTLPSELGFLTALTKLVLYSNDIQGNVPSEFGSLTALTYLDFSATNINGSTVPEKLCNLGRTLFITVTCAPSPLCSCCGCC